MTRVDPDPASPDPADPGGRAAFSQVLASRRMCRDFKPDPVADDVLDRVLAAAFRAPAAGNTDALDLVVLTGADTARHWDVTLPADRRLGFRWPGLMRAPVLVEVPFQSSSPVRMRIGSSNWNSLKTFPPGDERLFIVEIVAAPFPSAALG